MNLILKNIYEYCEKMSTSRSESLNQLERETNLKTLAPQMISGQLQGMFFEMLSKLIQPDTILEIGTFTGYATLSLAAGLSANGKIITIEANKELKYLSDKYFSESPYTDKIEAIVGDALDIIPSLSHQFDLVYIDANKKVNLDFFQLVIPKVKSGGLILVDNVLWSGKVVGDKKDKDTQIIHDFNQSILEDDRVENLVLPIRDGITMIRKI